MKVWDTTYLTASKSLMSPRLVLVPPDHVRTEYGKKVGLAVGRDEGTEVGCRDGTEEGCPEGRDVGWREGC